MGHEDHARLKGADILSAAAVDLSLGEHDHGFAALQPIHHLVEGGHAEVVLIHGDTVHLGKHEGLEPVGKQVGRGQAMEAALTDRGQQDDRIQEGGVVGGDQYASSGAFPALANDLGTDPQKSGQKSRDLHEIVPKVPLGALS